ncbi:NACHT domain-containing protein [Streptomyces sp. NPDC002888]|uniref:NACHT domain-containing protein n=1 Tax=Streptomyces sp. NPDC002888 TaxID=3364668 RepID=UPI003676B9E5
MTDGDLLEPERARAELKRLLNDLLGRKGWDQAELCRQLELKGTPLAKATISNALNSKKGPPARATLDAVVAVLGPSAEEAETLNRLRILAARTPDLLDRYLRAARRAAREHPYAGVLPGTTPPLASVYMRQRAHPDGDGSPRRPLPDPAVPGADQWVPGERILARDGNCVVLAGPGGGKSSLLRIGMAASLDRWLGGGTDVTVPVLVPAAELAVGRPLPEAIADSATSELSAFGLLESIPAEFFRTAPRPGVRWLVLVDGLDEVTDPEARQRVLNALQSIAQDTDASPYRFVVATRPLPAGSLRTLGKAVPLFELRPFEPDELVVFAEQWFRQLGLPDPPALATAFVTTAKDAGLLELARTPLMATMLCQLHAIDPDGPLPFGRGEVYERFVDLLHGRQHAAGKGGISAQTEAALGRYGPKALSRAHHTIDQLVRIAAHAAAERHGGNEEDVLAIVSSHADAARPTRVPRSTWDGFVIEVLHRSGLLTAHAGELVFLHQTLLEHLAARHTAHDDTASERAFHELFEASWSRRPAPWSRKKWSRPQQEPSYLGFLIDAWRTRGKDVDRSLRRLATDGGLEGCGFIADLKALGTTLPDGVVDAAVGTLQALARRSDPHDGRRVDAALCLEDLGHQSGLDILAGLAGGSTLRGDHRVEAARRLAVLGDPRGLDLLADLAASSAQLTPKEARQRARVAHTMFHLLYDHPFRHQEAVFAYGTQVCGMQRVEAAATLSLLGDARAEEILADLAAGSGLDLLPEHRVIAAGFLAPLDRSRACDALVDIATTSGHWDHSRVDAGKALMKLQDPRGPGILEDLAVDPELEESQRARAVKHRKRYAW